MRKLLVAALGLTCLFAVTAGAAVSKNVLASAPSNVAASADPGTNDGMPRVAPDQTRHKVVQHPKHADDDVFNLEGIGDGGDSALWATCTTNSKCGMDGCSASQSAYYHCQDRLDAQMCRKCL